MGVTIFRNHSVLLTLKTHFGEYPPRLTIHYPCKRNQDTLQNVVTTGLRLIGFVLNRLDILS
jgi:hypothetical protein